jgi:Kdo2-lipid IVA lauroyltransferase/acyltransferase
VSGAKTLRRGRWPHKRRPIRYFFEYLGLRLVGLIVRCMPVEAASAAMGWSWRLIAPHLDRHPRVLSHLALAFPALPEAERERIALDMWSNLGRVFAESFIIDRIVDQGRIEDRTGSLLPDVRQTGHGIVFVSLHTGNWELVITPANKAGIPVAGVYQKVKNPWVDHYLVESRRERYPRGLFAKGSDIALKLIRIGRDGGAVALLADLRDRRGAAVPFFGHAAPSTTFPALLARSTHSHLVAARVVRTGPVRFAIEGEVIEIPRTPDRDADILEGTRLIQARFESWVREHPEQWMWAHRRWG